MIVLVLLIFSIFSKSFDLSELTHSKANFSFKRLGNICYDGLILVIYKCKLSSSIISCKIIEVLLRK